MTTWSSRSEPVERGIRSVLIADDEAMPFRAFFRLLRGNPSFADWFSAQLAAFPSAAFYWELPPLTKATIDAAAEFVLIDAPGLAGISPEPQPFSGYFARATDEIVVFPNLGGDALLVVPTPAAPDDVYPHLATFLRGAPAGQVRALWRRSAETLIGGLGNTPLWLSTAGGGVAWLHVRIDRVPKYYSHRPYARPD